MIFTTIELSRRGLTALLRLNSPDKLNAINTALIALKPQQSKC